MANVVNTKPGKFTNVAVYASDPFYPSTNAIIRNLNYNPTISVQKGNLLAVIPEWGPNFRITFDLNIHSLYSSRSDGWANVLHFTSSGKDCCSIGDRIPGLWTNSKEYVFK